MNLYRWLELNSFNDLNGPTSLKEFMAIWCLSQKDFFAIYEKNRKVNIPIPLLEAFNNDKILFIDSETEDRFPSFHLLKNIKVFYSIETKWNSDSLIEFPKTVTKIFLVNKNHVKYKAPVGLKILATSNIPLNVDELELDSATLLNVRSSRLKIKVKDSISIEKSQIDDVIIEARELRLKELASQKIHVKPRNISHTVCDIRLVRSQEIRADGFEKLEYFHSSGLNKVKNIRVLNTDKEIILENVISLKTTSIAWSKYPDVRELTIDKVDFSGIKELDLSSEIERLLFYECKGHLFLRQIPKKITGVYRNDLVIQSYEPRKDTGDIKYTCIEKSLLDSL